MCVLFLKRAGSLHLTRFISEMLRTGDAARLPGTRIQNRCPVVSVGLDAIDGLMGGGLPVSSIYIISETGSRKYTPVLQRYFVAEGLSNNHTVFVSGPALDINDFVTNLPSCSTSTPNQEESDLMKPREDMKIAWRYQTMPAINSALSSKDKTKFDLTRKMDLNADDIQTFNSTSYSGLWRHLFDLITSEKFAVDKSKQILRIFLDGIGSPLFEDSHNCQRFIRNLKALIQQANVVLMLGVNESTLNEDENRILLLAADAYFRLDVPDSETKKHIGLEVILLGFLLIPFIVFRSATTAISISLSCPTSMLLRRTNPTV